MQRKKINLNAWQCDLGTMSVLRVPQGCYKLLIFDPKTTLQQQCPRGRYPILKQVRKTPGVPETGKAHPVATCVRTRSRWS
jgi:hypothetical protein